MLRYLLFNTKNTWCFYFTYFNVVLSNNDASRHDAKRWVGTVNGHDTNAGTPRAAKAALAIEALSDLSTRDQLSKAVLEMFPGRIATVSSFGAESAVLLGVIAETNPDIPVLFIDTGKHFPETLAYRDRLVALLGLTNLVTVRPAPGSLARVDPRGIRHGYDPDGCCALRKVAPLEAALSGYDAWISGRKRFHGATRESLPTVELEDGRVKLNPLADWGPEDLNAFITERNLPRHPLWSQGYLSIGCAVCTQPAAPGEGPRSGRWRGFAKAECGIHGRPGAREAS